MGIYVVTGGTKGIGGEAVRLLKQAGHTVFNIDRDRGDCCADLGTPEGRREAVEAVRRLFPDGIDGLASNAGVASTEPLSDTVRINYFGSVAVMEGLFGLLRLRRGRCAVTVSGSLAYSERNRFYVDRLLTDCGDEERIARLVDSFDPVEVDNAIYGSTKFALARWMRRSAAHWARAGVNLNAVAPGAVATTIMQGVRNMGASPDVWRSLIAPVTDAERRLMRPEEVAPVLVSLLMPGACGCSGQIFYCDAGTEAALRTEKIY